MSKALAERVAVLAADVQRMYDDDDYDIFDTWEVGEVLHLLRDVETGLAATEVKMERESK